MLKHRLQVRRNCITALYMNKSNLNLGKENRSIPLYEGNSLGWVVISSHPQAHEPPVTGDPSALKLRSHALKVNPSQPRSTNLKPRFQNFATPHLQFERQFGLNDKSSNENFIWCSCSGIRILFVYHTTQVTYTISIGICT